MKLEVAFVAVVAIIIVFALLMWVGGKLLKNDTPSDSIEESIEPNEPSDLTVDDLMIEDQTAAKKVKELTSLFNELETAVSIDELKEIKSKATKILRWFESGQNGQNSRARLVVAGGSAEKINELNNRYNVLLVKLCEAAVEDYKVKIRELVVDEVKQNAIKQMLVEIERFKISVETKAGNERETFDRLKELVNEIEDFYSN